MPNLEGVKNTLQEINTIIEKHNAKSQKFVSHQQRATKQIKGHYFSTIENDVSECQQNIQQCQGVLEKLRKQQQELEERIASALDQISSTYRACTIINDKLHRFLGHQELTFAPFDDSGPRDSDYGYQILRHQKPANHLSEGEKNAVALIYFLVNLCDGQNNIEETIVVVDDPVSSLDSNSLYQALGFLKNDINDYRQIFIFTHSFSFLRLLLNWRNRFSKKTGYYMIRNETKDKTRMAKIAPLDKTLKENETEYIYLFKMLKEFLDNNDQDIATAYPIPNMARKFWETFLVFFTPSHGNMYARTKELKSEGIDSQTLSAIYDFTNGQSHFTGAGLDPSLVKEAGRCVKNIFSVVEKVSPRHYTLLQQSIQDEKPIQNET